LEVVGVETMTIIIKFTGGEIMKIYNASNFGITKSGNDYFVTKDGITSFFNRNQVKYIIHLDMLQ